MVILVGSKQKVCDGTDLLAGLVLALLRLLHCLVSNH